MLYHCSRTRMPMVSFRIALGLALASLGIAPAAAQNRLPPGFVFLHDVAPGIAQDMRYATANNFTGHPLPGYAGGECVLRRDLADALKSVETDLASSGLGLKVYDCYRPVVAVRAMYAWATDGGSGSATKRFFPALDKRTLFSGYIAARSAHSTGSAVDLTLIKIPEAPAAPFDPAARYGSCVGPAAERAPDNSIDMGTGFDCFDDKSHTANANVNAEARHWRGVLVAAMRKRGLKNYFREWWHFSNGPASAPVYDGPIPARR
jgi:zinc D-Ala-D-Ala dipeptidase